MINIFYIGLLIFLMLIVMVTWIRNEFSLKKDLSSEWETGKVKKDKEDVKSIRKYYENSGDDKNKELIDDLTWKDLDMDEIFNQINYTKSSVGTEYLFDKLHNIHTKEIKLNKDEAHYKLFKEKNELREKVIFLLSKLGKQDYSDSSMYFYKKFNHINNNWLYIYLSFFLFSTIIFMLISLKIGLLIFLFSFVMNLFVYYKNRFYLERNLFGISYATQIIRIAESLTKIEDNDFLYYKKRLEGNIDNLGRIPFFEKILTIGKGTSEFEAVFEYIRIIFLLDYISYIYIIRILSKNMENYKNIWLTIGELDATISVVYYRHFLGNSYCVPLFSKEEKIVGSEMYHPLIENPISNDFHFTNGVLLTGSNASGKSIFLKAIAINAILGQTINTVHAVSWEMSRANIITSIAVKDDVLNGDSYFKAEITSLKRIIDAVSEGQSTVTFIDEILKGTNTIERISASSAILEWLAQRKGINIVATHDKELTEMNRKTHSNYHFTESIIENNIQFDYKLKKGPAISRNAIKLLALFNYPEEIVENSIEISRSF